MFVEALRQFGMLCIGIYRVKDPTGTEPTASSRRYVITNPPGDFTLMMSDLVSIMSCLARDYASSIRQLINDLDLCPLSLSLSKIFVLLQFDPGLEYHNRSSKNSNKSPLSTKRGDRPTGVGIGSEGLVNPSTG